MSIVSWNITGPAALMITVMMYAHYEVQFLAIVENSFVKLSGRHKFSIRIDSFKIQQRPQNRKMSRWKLVQNFLCLGEMGSRYKILFSRPQKAHPCAKWRHLTYWARGLGCRLKEEPRSFFQDITHPSSSLYHLFPLHVIRLSCLGSRPHGLHVLSHAPKILLLY